MEVVGTKVLSISKGSEVPRSKAFHVRYVTGEFTRAIKEKVNRYRRELNWGCHGHHG